MDEGGEAAVRIAPNRARAEEWALVLVAEGLAAKIVRAGDGFALEVPAREQRHAARALEQYEAENPRKRREVEPKEAAAPGAVNAAIAVSGVLLLFFLVAGTRDGGSVWFERGAAHAERILSGELHRCVTALMLHADLSHVLSNAVSGAFFFAVLFRARGVGLGLLLVLLSGAGGNLWNAWSHGAGHSTVGASTAVFGAIGCLAGQAVARRGRRGATGARRWVPLGAGFGLLAMFGAGEWPTDVWAHLFGLLVGTGLGMAAGRVWLRRPGAGVQSALAFAAVILVGMAWSLALR